MVPTEQSGGKFGRARIKRGPEDWGFVFSYA